MGRSVPHFQHCVNCAPETSPQRAHFQSGPLTGLQLYVRVNFNLSLVGRKDLMSLTSECVKVTGIPYVMDAYRKEAEKFLK